MKTNIAINGYCGRMGTAIYEESANFKNLKITVGCDVEEKILNKKTDGVILTSDLTSSKDLFDVVIDFTLPIPSIETIYNCVTINKPIVIGTTGYNNEQLNNIKDASQTIPILLAPNMSIGVNVSLSALSMIARSLKNYKVKIEEVHHKNKIDSPSGTAIKMAQVICDAQGIELGDINSNNCPITFESKREDTEIGTHEVTFQGESDSVSLTHIAKNRSIFANGAIATAIWLQIQKPGLYSYQDYIKTKT